MRRFAPFLAFIAGLIVVILLIPSYNAAQPKAISLTRRDAVPLADRQARQLGIHVDRAWATLSWIGSPLIEKDLRRSPHPL